MHDLDEALAGITEIRRQLAQTLEFRGYGPATVAATGLLAFAAAGAQLVWIADPAGHMSAYLTLWILTACIAVVAVGAEMLVRSRRIHSILAAEMVGSAAEHFIPSGVAGALLTIVLLRFGSGERELLPGLWQILFSLGLFASNRSLPRAAFAVGLWYLAAGLACIAFARGGWSLSPWAMGIPFGVGQIFLALVLHKHQEEANHA